MNEALLPGGRIAGSTITIYASYGPTSIYEMTVERDGQVFEEARTYLAAPGVYLPYIPSAVTITGTLWEEFFVTPAEWDFDTSFTWTFDEDGQIVDWQGGATWGTEAIDPYTSPGGDGYGFYLGSDPGASGAWTLVSSVPAPIPLPASAWVLLGALAGMGALRQLQFQTGARPGSVR